MKKCSLRGFTLIELMIVMAIIGILASVMIPAVVQSRCITAMATHAKTFQPTRVVDISCVSHDPGDETHLRCTANILDVENQPKKLVADCEYLYQKCVTRSVTDRKWPAGGRQTYRVVWYRPAAFFFSLTIDFGQGRARLKVVLQHDP